MEQIRYFLSQILFLIEKEFLALLKDRSSRVILVAPVFMQCLLFGYAATYDLTSAPYVVYDGSRSRESTELMRRIDASGIFVREATLDSPSQVAGKITSSAAAIAICIPPGFAEDIATGGSGVIELILDGRNSVTAGMASAYIASIAARFGAELRGSGGAVSVAARPWFNENLDSRWTILVGLIAALAMLQTLMTAAFSVAREREQGTFDQLLVTPLVPWQILIGKALPPIMVGLLQSTIIFLVIRFWFGIPMAGSLPLLYLVLLVFNCATVGIGLSISAFALTMQQAMLYAFFAAVPMMLLSGIFSPVHNMAEVLQWLTFANPLRFGVDAVRRIYLEGAGLEQVWFDFVPLFCVMCVFMPLAAWLFRNRLS
jgi:ABC-2 type transport system permease protein